MRDLITSVWTRKNNRILVISALVTGLVGGPAVMSATAAAPAAAVTRVSPGSCGSVLLAGSAWLAGHGVSVKSNGSDQGSGASCGGTNKVDGIKTGSEWQCVELVNRLYVTKGWIKATWPGNGGRSSPGARDSMYDEAPGSLSKQANGSISYVGPGDVVSINVYDNGVFQADGHVLVVNASGRITGGSVPLVSQNGGDSTDAIVTSSASLSGDTLTIPSSGNWSYSVIGVVHAPTAIMASGPENLLSNASWGMGQWLPWQTLPVGGGTMNWTAYNNPSVAEQGSWYGASSTSTAGGSIYQDVAVSTSPGQSYTFSIWIRSATSTPVSGTVALWGIGGTHESGSTSFTVGPTWTQISAPLDVTQTGHTTLRAQVYESTTGTTYDFDGAAIS